MTPQGGVRLHVLFVQLIVVVLGLEIALRLYNPLPFRVRGHHLVLPAHRSYTFDNRGAPKLDPITVHTKNALGFRGPDPQSDFGDRLTIVTVGGSTTECLFLSDGKTWTDALGRRLAARAPTVWVNNAGFDGQSTFGHLVLLREVIVPLRPKIAVFLIGINDLGLAKANGFDASLASGTPRTGWRRAIDFVADRSEVASALANLWGVRRARRAGLNHDPLDLAHVEPVAADPATTSELIAGVTRYLGDYERRVREIVELCTQNGIDAVLVTQPLLVGDAIDPSTGVDLGGFKLPDGLSGRLEWRMLEMYNDVTRRVAADTRRLLVDLARELPKDSRLYYDFMHFTNEGAERCGAVIAMHLEQHLQH